MIIKKIIIPALTLVLAAPTYAMMCPSNFNMINDGDSLTQVKQQCGPPSSEKEIDTSDDAPQEWNYYVVLNPSNPATIKTTVAFVGGKVTNMSVNGTSIGNSSICAGKTVKIGDSQDMVKNACGNPEFINKGTGSDAATTKKMTEITYSTSATTVTLTFINGRLKLAQ